MSGPTELFDPGDDRDAGGVSLGNLNPLARLQAFAQLLSERGPDATFARLSPLDAVIVEPPNGFRSSTSGQWVLDTITCLYSIDQAFETALGYFGHVYILGDSSIFEAFGDILAPPPPPQLRSALLGSLATMGLSYRFNAARKFGYQSSGLTQLRLNGWGRDIVYEMHLDASRLYRSLFGRCCDILREQRNEYDSLLSLCTSSVRPLNVEGIRAVNERLTLRIVT